MANITKTLSGADTFQEFSHTLYDWAGIELLDPTKVETLVGFEIISNPIQAGEGDVELVPNSDTALVFKGVFENQAAFESAHSTQVNGMAYYDKDLDIGRKYVDGTYEEINYEGINFSTTYSGTYGAGLFPNTSISWKNIITNEEFSRSGWPPPDDPMTQFIFAINIDPGTFKSRNVKIRYDVRIETTPDDTIEYREDVYTYTKEIQNTMSVEIGEALKTFFDKFPPMDYATGEIIEDASSS